MIFERRRHLWQKALTLFLLGFFLLAAAMPQAMAADVSSRHFASRATLRVAYYPLDGFFEYDENGVETGYGVELLDKISRYTGLQFEYIKTDSWEDTKRMLLDGTADLRMPVTLPMTPSETMGYNATSIIDTYHVMLALKTREDLYYQDFDTIRNLKVVAISENFYNGTAVRSYLDNIGIPTDHLIFCNEYNECYQKLVSGEADALVTNIMDMDDTMKMLARFNSVSNYFSMTIGNPMLDVLDEALAQIKLDEPLFLSTLYATWFPERTVVPMTLEESEYLSSIDQLTFAFRSDEGYLSRYQDDGFYGIYVEQAKAVCEKLGVKFDAVSFDDCQQGKAAADVFCGFFYDQNYAEQWDFCISTPVSDINYYVIQKKETYVNDDTCKVAAVEKFYYTKEFLQKKFRPDQLIYFDTYEDCLRAVANGRADVTIINNYIAEYYLEMYQFNDLSARLTGEYSHLFCFATSNNNELLASILSKTLSSITREQMEQLNIRGTEKRPDTNFIEAFLYRDPILFAVIVAGVSVLIFVLIVMTYFVRRSDQQNKVLEKALSAKSDFLARMSHDMRTPLNAVLGFAKLGKEDKDDPKSVEDSLNKIQSSGEYLLGLINDVLDASKIESGKVELRTEIVNGPEFLSSIAQELKAQGQLRGITLVADLTKANTTYVKMDKLRTRQIYTNLINNAFKFSQPGSTVEWVMEDTRADEGHMEFRSTITDHGCGMSEAFMQHMFEPFTQEYNPQKQSSEGTGLGLTIVKKYVELAGGSIEVESKLGVGTTFTLHMKREIPTAEEIAAIKQQDKLPDDALEALSGKRVLLCEDHPLNREIAVRQLSKVGVTTDCAENGQIGVDLFTHAPAGHYDAILMDVRMPVMDGLDAARHIRAASHEDAKSIPIIAVTANAYSEDVDAALGAGMNKHLPKPIDPQLLYKTLYELIVQGKGQAKE